VQWRLALLLLLLWLGRWFSLLLLLLVLRLWRLPLLLRLGRGFLLLLLLLLLAARPWATPPSLLLSLAAAAGPFSP
jgi:hypothetical protein